MKRILLISSTTSINNLGGISTFYKNFIELFEKDCIIDILTDTDILKNIKNSDYDEYFSKYTKNVNFFNIKKTMGVDFKLYYHFSQVYSNIEKNYLMATYLIEHLRDKLYDLVIISDYRYLDCICSLGLSEFMNIWYYFHNGDLLTDKLKPYKKYFTNYVNGLVKNCNVLFPSEGLKNHFISVYGEPMRYKVLGLLNNDFEKYDVNTKKIKDSVLYFGRTTTSKGYEKFIDYITQNPHKKYFICTNNNQIDKWEDFIKNNKNYDVTLKTSLFDLDKHNFISQCEILLNPSDHETISYATLECLYYMQVNVDKNYKWNRDFFPFPEKLNSINDEYTESDNKKLIKYYFKQNEIDWINFVNEKPESKKSRSTKATLVTDHLNKNEYIPVSDIYSEREKLIYEELEILYKLKDMFYTYHDKDQTYFVKDKNYIVKKDQDDGLENLF